MTKHFVGRVFVFGDPPSRAQLEVDIPVATQSTATDSLLIQMEAADLSDIARKRIEPFYDQTTLPLQVLRENHGIDPTRQVDLARHIMDRAEALWPLLNWTSPRPQARAIRAVCELMWEYLIPEVRRPRGALTAQQLAFLINRFVKHRNVKAVIELELANQLEQKQVQDPDRAVEDTLDFLRNWASYHFPRYLMALSRIQQVVFADLGLPAGDYSILARDVENFFLPPGIAALDEYGIPLQVGQKLRSVLGDADDLDTVISALKRLRFDATLGEGLSLTPFESALVIDAKKYL